MCQELYRSLSNETYKVLGTTTKTIQGPRITSFVRQFKQFRSVLNVLYVIVTARIIIMILTFGNTNNCNYAQHAMICKHHLFCK